MTRRETKVKLEEWEGWWMWRSGEVRAKRGGMGAQDGRREKRWVMKEGKIKIEGTGG